MTFGLRTHRVAAHPESLGSATRHTLYASAPGTEGHVHVADTAVEVPVGVETGPRIRLTLPYVDQSEYDVPCLVLRRMYQSVPAVGASPAKVTFGLRTQRTEVQAASLGSATRHALYEVAPDTAGHVQVVELPVAVATGLAGVRDARLTAPKDDHGP